MHRESPTDRTIRKAVTAKFGRITKSRHSTRRKEAAEAKAKELRSKPSSDLDAVAGKVGRAGEPPKKVAAIHDGRKVEEEVFGGGGRSFPAEFSKRYWELAGENPKCALCHEEITTGLSPKRLRRGARHSIDHKEPWSSVRTEINEYEVCKDGYHWKVALRRDALRAICDGSPDPNTFNKLEDRPNLRPVHARCNSSKGGKRGTDEIAPVRKGECPGASCRVRQAAREVEPALAGDAAPVVEVAGEAAVEMLPLAVLC